MIGGGDWAENRIFPDCMRALMSDKPIIIRNPGAVRPWQHVLEPLSGYLTLCSLLYTDGKKFSGAWNFGPLSKNMVSVKHLVEETIDQWGGGKYILEHGNCANAEANYLYLDISKAVNLLKWCPVFELWQTLIFTIDEYKVDNLSHEEIFDQRTAHIEKYIELKKKLEEDKNAKM